MSFMIRTLIVAATMCSTLMLADGLAKTFATIGTGGVTGVYYPTGGAIAKMVNAKRGDYGIRMSVESTGGSVYNLNAVASGDLEFGIAQADLHHQAWHGTGDWSGHALGNLRSVMGLHPEMVTLVAAVDSEIRRLADLRGKHVNIGNPGSGNRANAIEVLEAGGLNWESDIRAESLAAPEAPRLLQDSRIDAFFYTVGHPSGAISEVSSGRRKVRFVPLTGLEEFMSTRPYFAKARIPVDLYPQAVDEGPVETIGLVTTLVTSDTVGDEVVYAVVREVVSNFESFTSLHPALARITKADLLKGLTAPLHPGAERAYRELGLLE